jgi:arylsulfatase A-like enzyme
MQRFAEEVCDRPWRHRARRRSLLATLLIGGAVLAARGAAAVCVGDCDGNGVVTIDELVVGARIALGTTPASACSALVGTDPVPVVSRLVRAILNARDGCRDAATATPAAPPHPTPRPNIVIIELDDVRADGIDRMPTVLSRLVGQGVRFTNSFVPLSLCCPSRASLLSGLYALRHGARHVEGRIGGAPAFRAGGADRQTIAVWLRDQGYATGMFGKYLNVYHTEHDAGPGGGFYIPPGWERWRVFVNEHYGGRHGHPYELVDESGTITAYSRASDDDYSTTVLGRELRQFVRDAAAAGRPFFAMWTPYTAHIDLPSHLPVPTDRHLDAFAGLAPARPPNWNEADRSDKPRWVQAKRISPLGLGATDLARRRSYEALLSVDEEIARLLDELAALGVADRTVIVLTSDNGVSWGEHGLTWQMKECPYEQCLRVPLVVYDPRATGSLPRTAAVPVLNLDVPATLADLAGVAVPVAIDGLSFRSALAGSRVWRRRDFLLEHWSRLRDAVLQLPAEPPLDGDRLRVAYGPWPKTVRSFEFDADGRATAGAIRVPIGGTAAATLEALAAALSAAIPAAEASHSGASLLLADRSPEWFGVSLLDEIDQADRIAVYLDSGDFFGVRDVADHLTYVEHATGEVELYDLASDPWQLENRADDPRYAVARARLHDRLGELLGSLAPPDVRPPNYYWTAPSWFGGETASASAAHSAPPQPTDEKTLLQR